MTKSRLPLHLAGTRYGQQSGDRDFACRGAAAETDFAPLRGAPQRTFHRMLLDSTLLTEKCEESFEMHRQCGRQIAHILITASA